MSLTAISPTRSSWITGIGYRTTPDGHSYLAIFTNQNFAWLVIDVPPTLPGLLAAGHVTAKDDGELSIGAAVHRLVLQKESEYTRQKIEGKEMWRLRALMMKGADKWKLTHNLRDGIRHSADCTYKTCSCKRTDIDYFTTKIEAEEFALTCQDATVVREGVAYGDLYRVERPTIQG